ncbi:MAG TPA: ATP-binding protein [Xanthomonadales bacterium]|nr:ATP-binding protein [Xanthomonadales bacterium]
MKNKRGQIIPSKILEKTPDATELLKNIENLTVEDVVVIYAYAEAIVETVREPLIILDGNLRIKTANKSFFDTFKVTKKETYNKLIFDLGNGQWDIPELKKLLRKILPKSSQFNDFEVNHEFKGLGKKIMLLNARRIVLEGHETELILLAIEDVTQHKLIEKQKDDFFAIASHELKTPVTSIKAYTQILAKKIADFDDTKKAYFLKNIDNQTDKLVNLINDFLDMSKIQAGKLVFAKKKFDLDALIKKIVVDFQYMTKTHQIKKIGEIKKSIIGDQDRIDQVLVNLLTNAIKYSPEGKEIIVRSHTNKNTVTVSIQDFGRGIPQVKQKHVFDKYFQVSEKSDDGKKGFGLGLYITSEIVKRHKGKIWVESTKGKGSTFYFTLPLNLKSQKLHK